MSPQPVEYSFSTPHECEKTRSKILQYWWEVWAKDYILDLERYTDGQKDMTKQAQVGMVVWDKDHHVKGKTFVTKARIIEVYKGRDGIIDPS